MVEPLNTCEQEIEGAAEQLGNLHHGGGRDLSQHSHSSRNAGEQRACRAEHTFQSTSVTAGPTSNACKAPVQHAHRHFQQQ